MLMILFFLLRVLRVMLDICDTFASSHGLVFNAAKTQLICFRQRYTNTFPPEIIFNGSTLRFVEEVSHLGHILAYNLDDKQDIIRTIKELNRKANSVLCKFSSLDPFVKCYLLKSYCLSLYPPLVSLLTIAQKYRSCTEQAVTESLESSIQLTQEYCALYITHTHR